MGLYGVEKRFEAGESGEGETGILGKRRPSKRRVGGEASGVEVVNVFVNVVHTSKVRVYT